MAGENKYRWICEFCAGFTFVCFLLKFKETQDAGTVNACIGSAAVIVFSWLANCVSDKRDARQGIQCNKRQIISKIFRVISYIRYWIEVIAISGLILLGMAYLITRSNEGHVFETIALFEIEAIIWGIMCVSGFQFLASLLLLFLTNLAITKNPMSHMQQ